MYTASVTANELVHCFNVLEVDAHFMHGNSKLPHLMSYNKMSYLFWFNFLRIMFIQVPGLVINICILLIYILRRKMSPSNYLSVTVCVFNVIYLTLYEVSHHQNLIIPSEYKFIFDKTKLMLYYFISYLVQLLVLARTVVAYRGNEGCM